MPATPEQLSALHCTNCNRTPEQIDEYVIAAEENEMTPNEYVWAEEGTLNPTNSHFTCTACYIAIGMPSAPGQGWKTP